MPGSLTCFTASRIFFESRASPGGALVGDRSTFSNDLRGHEDQQLGLVILMDSSLKKASYQRQIAEEWYQILIVQNALLIYAAEHYCFTVIYKYLCADFSCVNTGDLKIPGTTLVAPLDEASR